MDRPKETHITYIFGIPLIETRVFLGDGKGPQLAQRADEYDDEQELDDKQEDIFLRLKTFLNFGTAAPVIMIILSVVVAFSAILYFVTLTSPEKLSCESTRGSLQELDGKLYDAKRELQTAAQQNRELNQKIAAITADKTDLIEKLGKTETKLSSLKTELESAKERESKLQKENENLKSDKDGLTKDLGATKFTLGNCKNKNMDHEVRSLELLQEIEELKKELKGC